jgi:hypothetical protein
MKTLILTTVALLGMSQAQAADQLVTVMKCRPAVLRHDVGMSLEVKEGGFAGIPQIVIKRRLLGRVQTETYMVRKEQYRCGVPGTRCLGAPIVYKGNGINLSVNFTTTPTPDGAHHGTLVTRKNGTEEIVCKR